MGAAGGALEGSLPLSFPLAALRFAAFAMGIGGGFARGFQVEGLRITNERGRKGKKEREREERGRERREINVRKRERGGMAGRH